MGGQAIKIGQVRGVDIAEVVRGFHAEVVQPDIELVIFFCAREYNLEVMAEAVRNAFPDTAVVGCTTAGEIGPSGYHGYSLTGASFSRSVCSAVAGVLPELSDFSLTSGHSLVQQMLQQLEARNSHAGENNSFAILLVDGFSKREELVAHVLQNLLGRIPLVGGSAGGGLQFRQPYVYFDGRFRTDSACLIIISTPLPFLPFKTQHFLATDERLVVTAAEPLSRRVIEINGLPAAEEYARIVGVDVTDLDPLRFAASPVVVMIDGTEYVRSIQCANADGSLTFFCAIEEGLVLRVAQGQNLLSKLEAKFDQIQSQIGIPQLVLGFDCVLRRQEIIQSGLETKVGDIFRSNRTVGFNTYGEQYKGVHVNQTLAGIAIGAELRGND